MLRECPIGLSIFAAASPLISRRRPRLPVPAVLISPLVIIYLSLSICLPTILQANKAGQSHSRKKVMDR